MIIADKILALRKKLGYSQEELAERLNVSRQSISKWEGAQSIPDINKIIEMSKIFGVSTDYLLKDDIEGVEYLDSIAASDVSYVKANEVFNYLEACKKNGRQVALATLLCILSPALLIFLCQAAESSVFGEKLSEAVAVAIGLVVLIVIVIIAVSIFIIAAGQMKPYQYLKDGNFELEYGVFGIVKEEQKDFAPIGIRNIVISISLMIGGVLPLIISDVFEVSDFVNVQMIVVLLILVGIGCYILIRSETIKGSFASILLEKSYKEKRELDKREERLSAIYWPIIVASYLIWSFLTNDWHITWVIWPAAGLVFASISAIFIKK